MVRYAVIFALAWLGLSLSPGSAEAQRADGSATLRTSAMLGANGAPLEAGLRWRIFSAHADADGSHPLLVESALARPAFTLPAGDYILHVSFGLASATKGVSLGTGELRDKTLAISGGALRIGATIGAARSIRPMFRSRSTSPSATTPRPNSSTRRRGWAKSSACPREPITLSRPISTPSASARWPRQGHGRRRRRARAHQLDRFRRCPCRGRQDCRLTLKHRFAKLTIKLVKTHEGEALANTTFTVLTPGGDIIRELIGAFPSLVLAEGEYVVIARHDAKTYQSTFNVQSGLDQDVEVIAKEDDTQGQ